VLSVILCDLFSEYLAAAVPCIWPVNAGGGDEYDLADAGGSGGLENLEGAAHIEVEEIVRVFLAPIFVDAVPGGDVDDAVAAAKYLRQLRAVQNRPLDEYGFLSQRRWRANIENDRRVALTEQPGYEGLARDFRILRSAAPSWSFPRLTPFRRAIGSDPSQTLSGTLPDRHASKTHQCGPVST
jgi:hypothetical protein